MTLHGHRIQFEATPMRGPTHDLKEIPKPAADKRLHIAVFAAAAGRVYDHRLSQARGLPETDRTRCGRSAHEAGY